MTVLLDDHLLRDWLAGSDDALDAGVGNDDVATTNLWYARLCKTAAAHRGGALFATWGESERAALVSALIDLPPGIQVAPMRELAWRMGALVAANRGLSTLGAEAVAAAEALPSRLLVSSRDDGPGIRACAAGVGIDYRALTRR